MMAKVGRCASMRCYLYRKMNAALMDREDAPAGKRPSGLTDRHQTMTDLLHLVQALRLLRHQPGPTQSRHQQRHQDCDDTHDDKELDEGEPASA